MKYLLNAISKFLSKVISFFAFLGCCLLVLVSFLNLCMINFIIFITLLLIVKPLRLTRSYQFMLLLIICFLLSLMFILISVILMVDMIILICRNSAIVKKILVLLLNTLTVVIGDCLNFLQLQKLSENSVRVF